MSRPRSVRVEDADLDLADRIKAARPSFHADGDIFRLALVRGLRLLAAEATAPGPNQYGGMPAAQLAMELRQLLLPALDLLAMENQVPAMLRGAGAGSMTQAMTADGGAADAAPALTPEDMQAQVYEQNTNDLRSLLSSLDDDDD